jgi:D-glycero-alpha-D-manno-heptose-7-phosphate kinase
VSAPVVERRLSKVSYRAKAPLRLGLAGGGTDIPAYSDRFGGACLNATINMYAFASIHPRGDGKIELVSADFGRAVLLDAAPELGLDGELDLLKGVYNRIIRDFGGGEPLAFTLITDANVPVGSGLGTSSAVTVAVVGAFREWLRFPLGEYELARLAFDIERSDLRLAGGKQDQYAATFGGVNFMEFVDGDVIVNPLRIKQETLLELENNLLLYYTGKSRYSATIIEEKVRAVQHDEQVVERMHHLKTLAFEMKRLLLKGELDRFGELLDVMWQEKKRTAEHVSSPLIDELYAAAREAGASGGKVSGAGGGGFVYFYCPGATKWRVGQALSGFAGDIRRFQFTEWGLQSWCR